MTRPQQLIQVGHHQVPLPEGVTVSDWSLEKVRWQNPRIRAYLGCIRLLEGVLDSNYAILHCSPQRLREIWRQVHRVTELMRSDLAPTLGASSQIPALEEARQRAATAYQMASRTFLAEIERTRVDSDRGDLAPVRKLLCVSLGKLQSFLQETFAQIIAGDPRSLHDADYFLSRRFPRDIEEAEWLHVTVSRLWTYLQDLGRRRGELLTTLEALLRRERTVPDGRRWRQVEELLQEFLHKLAPMLKEVLALRGIRFDEMEVLDRYAVELPAYCRLVFELRAMAGELAEEVLSRARDGGAEPRASVQELEANHAVIGRRIAELLVKLDTSIQDMLSFVPLWLGNIELRRALLLHRGWQLPEDLESE